MAPRFSKTAATNPKTQATVGRRQQHNDTASILNIPREVQHLIANNLNYASKIALSLTCHFMHDYIIIPKTKDGVKPYTIHDLLKIECWRPFCRHTKPEAGRDYFACTKCCKILDVEHFITHHVRAPWNKPLLYDLKAEDEANIGWYGGRQCIDCFMRLMPEKLAFSWNRVHCGGYGKNSSRRDRCGVCRSLQDPANFSLRKNRYHPVCDSCINKYREEHGCNPDFLVFTRNRRNDFRLSSEQLHFDAPRRLYHLHDWPLHLDDPKNCDDSVSSEHEQVAPNAIVGPDKERNK